MKFLKILVLLIVVASFLPIEGFCDDHHINANQEHHCVLACQFCHHLVSPETNMAARNLDQSSRISFNYSFQYQAPILDQTHRPPIVSL